MEERIRRMVPMLDEKQKRLYLAAEALSYGRGGISEVSRITKVSRNKNRTCNSRENTGVAGIQ